MSKKHMLALFALTVLSMRASAEGVDSYFPSSLTEPTYECRFGEESYPSEIASSFALQWYSSQLAAAAEPSLLARSNEAPRKRGSALRFTWLRSFDPPVFVRLENLDTDRPKLIAKRLSGAGGYDPGEIDKSIERDLAPEETRTLFALLKESDLPNVKPINCEIGLDGAEWLIETADEHGYRFYKRWSPGKGEIRRLGLFLLKLTGWNNKPIY